MLIFEQQVNPAPEQMYRISNSSIFRGLDSSFFRARSGKSWNFALSSCRAFAFKKWWANKYEPKEIAEMLEFVEGRLVEADKERYGPKYRGRTAVLAQLKREAPSNVKRKHVNLRTAYTELNTLIYTRHALRHGFKSIREFKPDELAKSLLGVRLQTILSIISFFVILCTLINSWVSDRPIQKRRCPQRWANIL
jgi:hypothetical protein